ncbi:hypothetical protein L596_002641 [Steinernema carpocapsae]|uniref:Uncharacterized protein n=1 Tax=Steinernema carpocapsae TaxID=34508 RepID=A0A4U8UPT8_STECR|nr:hypothetical protein L596_002641 [Steinernema carpocapsae]
MAVRSKHRKFRLVVGILICLVLLRQLSLWLFDFDAPKKIVLSAHSCGYRSHSRLALGFSTDEECEFIPDNIDGLDCEKIIEGDENYIKLSRERRVKIKEVDDSFPVDCRAIHARGCYPNYPLSSEEAEFPIAFAIVVYKDYLIVESIFNAIYAPQNRFCYILDRKTDPAMRKLMHSLARCFPNVHVLTQEFPLDSYGHNMNAAYLTCYEHLLGNGSKWKYVVSLQNHDMPLRTNRDLVRILKIFNGSNDVEVTKPNKNRIPLPKWTRESQTREYSWTLNSLNIVRNKSLPLDGNATLLLTKGGTATMLTYDFVRFILRDLNVSELLKRLNERDYTDEMLFTTLHSSDVLNAPGGHTTMCLKKSRFFSKGMARSTHWYDKQHCHSGCIRHNVCIQGIENVHEMKNRHGLFMNKFLPEFDYGAIVCHLKKLMRQKMNPEKWATTIDVEYYNSLPNIRLHNLRQRGETVDMKSFDCSLLGKDALI